MLRSQLLQADGNENKESILLEQIAMREQELGMYDSIRNKLQYTPLIVSTHGYSGHFGPVTEF